MPMRLCSTRNETSCRNRLPSSTVAETKSIPMSEIQLETERLLLRMWREDDFEAYAEICADPEVMRYLGGKPLSRLDAWRNMAMMVGHWHLRGYGHWVVEEKASGKFIGRIGFLNAEGWPGFELGWTSRATRRAKDMRPKERGGPSSTLSQSSTGSTSLV